MTIFKQFDAMTDRFAVETLELSVNGVSEYWSLIRLRRFVMVVVWLIRVRLLMYLIR